MKELRFFSLRKLYPETLTNHLALCPQIAARLIIATVLLLIGSCQLAEAQTFFDNGFANVGATLTPKISETPQNSSPSYNDLRKSFYKFGNNQRQLDDSWILKQQSGAPQAATFRSQQQAGMTQQQLSQFIVVEKGTMTNAKAAVSSAVPHPFMQQEFSAYANPLLNQFGPPRYPVPVTHILPNSSTITNMAPRTFTNLPYVTGAPASDLVTHALLLNGAQRTAEALLDPSFQSEQAAFQAKLQVSSLSAGAAANQTFAAALTAMPKSLINVANENAATPASRVSLSKSLAQAVWMVQQLYHNLFVPIALLLILPGAVATQTKSIVQSNVVREDASEDLVSPFVGILRALIAVIMIPATQLIISYSIDIGNSMTSSVQQLINPTSILSWAAIQTLGTAAAGAATGGAALAAQSTSSAMTGAIAHNAQMLLGLALNVLIDFQIVMMCYLFLMGPIAAALYAWPSNAANQAGAAKFFKIVLSSWIDAVTLVALWRFWWCTILLCMSTRIQWLQQIGQYNPKSPWETATYTAFLVMLAAVPFAPFDFKPGQLIDNLLSKAGVGSKK